MKEKEKKGREEGKKEVRQEGKKEGREERKKQRDKRFLTYIWDFYQANCSQAHWLSGKSHLLCVAEELLIIMPFEI